jgi:hypothetical protein
MHNNAYEYHYDSVIAYHSRGDLSLTPFRFWVPVLRDTFRQFEDTAASALNLSLRRLVMEYVFESHYFSLTDYAMVQLVAARRKKEGRLVTMDVKMRSGLWKRTLVFLKPELIPAPLTPLHSIV